MLGYTLKYILKVKLAKHTLCKIYKSPNEIVLTLLTFIKTKLGKMGRKGMFLA